MFCVFRYTITLSHLSTGGYLETVGVGSGVFYGLPTQLRADSVEEAFECVNQMENSGRMKYMLE